MALEYIDKGFRGELMESLSNPRKVHEICLKLLNAASQVLKLGLTVANINDGWIVVNHLIRSSNEYVLARFYAENIALAQPPPIDGMVVEMFIRDSLTCMEKIRVLVGQLTHGG